MDSGTATTIVGTVAGLVGGVAGRELLARIIPTRDKQAVIDAEERQAERSAAERARIETREDLVWMREEMSRITQELDVWRNRYLELVKEYANTQIESEKRHSEAMRAADEKYSILLRKYEALERELIDLRKQTGVDERRER